MVNMGGLLIRQPLPTHILDYLDPFILLHHGHIHFKKDDPLDKQGVGPHPHRGFSPVTFMFKGGSHHRDSRGNDFTVMEGGVQWMNSGMGIIHSERPAAYEQELIQLWVNSPAKNKMDIPTYTPVVKEQIPVIQSQDGKVNIQLVSGEINGVKGVIPTLSPINSLMVHFEEGGGFSFELEKSHNAFIYILSGKISIENYGLAEEKNMYVFDNNGTNIGFKSISNGYALLMTGEPLNEKIVSHGPFVMNTESQIMEAIRDYQMGKMGVLIEE
jgi:hypothetical protein